jgi:hypothetical protein
MVMELMGALAVLAEPTAGGFYFCFSLLVETVGEMALVDMVDLALWQQTAESFILG